ncbi:MAG: LPS-assembly protein LptD [Alphaproteobacteria bacterium]|nr:LPS-assembly protein LptD [Alphaproteobacteria bacterium]
MRAWARFAAVMLLLLAGLAARPLAAQMPRGGAGDQPVYFSADSVTYDDELGLVTATGNVEFVQGERILAAHAVTYNRRTEIVTASGDVSLLNATGDVLFADHAEFSADLKDGFIDHIRVLMADRSRLAGIGGERREDRVTILRRAVYSPCDLCREDPTRAPLWQIKAAEVVHDQLAQEVEYKDATMEIFGVPVFYTPYLAHPDSTVKKRTGFLAPSFGSDSTTGRTMATPFYIDIAPDKDATITPIFTTDQGVVASGQYRQRFQKGAVTLDGSYVNADRVEGNDVRQDRHRGHFKADGGFDIDDNWRSKFRIYRASDETYLRRFRFDSAPTIRSTGQLEGFFGQNYASVAAFKSQDLRTDIVDNLTPTALPIAAYSFVGESSEMGGYWTFDTAAAALYRDVGPQSRRLAAIAGYHLPFRTEGGHMFEVSNTLRADAYSVEGVDQRDPANFGAADSGFTGRLFPQTAITWRYPLVNAGDGYSQLIEPIASVVAGPDSGNPGRIPNEDSQDFEFDETNLFRPNRLPGYDRIDTGQRLNYGLRTGVWGVSGGSSSLFFGQSLRAREGSAFTQGSGVEDELSDVVGRIQVSPHTHLDLLYRFRLDHDDFSPRRSEFGFRLGPPALTLIGNYVFLDRAVAGNAFPTDREQILARLSSQLTDNWSTFFTHQRDLTEETGGPLLYRLGLRYSDECIVVDTTLSRRFTSDVDVPSGTTFFLRVVFKNLGEVTGGVR